MDRMGDSVEENLYVDLRNPLPGLVDTDGYLPCEPAEAPSDRRSQAGRRGHAERQGCSQEHGPVLRPHRLFRLIGVRLVCFVQMNTFSKKATVRLQISFLRRVIMWFSPSTLTRVAREP